MGIESWSTTPASNNSAPPAGAPEGMAPSAVNNVIRQQMADHRAQWNDAEWFNFGDGEGGVTLTYVAADQFKVEGVDVSTTYHVGRRVRVVGTGTGTIFGTINAAAFSIDTTVTVTFDSGSLSNETLTVSLGIISARNEAMKLDAQRLVKGVIEANANFVDFVVFGPALDPVKDWHKRLGSGVATALMLATVEDTGADTEVNVWDLTDAGLVSGTPLATVTITGAATPTSIAAAMGYLIIGSEDGVSIIKPHDGAWAERTEGWPKSLSTTTTPALTDNDVRDVCAGFSDQPRRDPRTGGPMPTFGVSYGTGAHAASVLKDDGNVWGRTDAVGNPGCAIWAGRFVYANNNSGDRILASSGNISSIQSDDWARTNLNGGNDNIPAGLGADSGFDMADDLLAIADTDGLTIEKAIQDTATNFDDSMATAINRTYNTGWMPGGIRGAWLANSKTADRSYKANTLTENGTVTETAVASGAELKGYSGFSSSNYFSRASDADWDVITTGSSCLICWFKTSGTSGTEWLFGYGNAGNTIRNDILMQADGAIIWQDDGATALVDTLSSTNFGDGVWHMVVTKRISSTERELWIDGVLEASNTGDAGSLSDSGNLPLRMGYSIIGALPAVDTTIALCRLSVTIPTAAQIRHMYETERRMFEANAKCLLQSGTTDAVLDVSIDPITGKVGVVQTDDEVLFDGLVIDEEPALPAGAANWEHVARYGGDRLVLTNANLYADVAAKDIREELEELRGKALPNDLPTFSGVSFGNEFLSDYQEGLTQNAFTPGISFGGGSTGISYSVQTGMYVKIGRLVWANIRIILTNKGSSTGVARITGLPITAANIAGEPVGSLAPGSSGVQLVNLGTNYTQHCFGVAAGATTVSIQQMGDNVGLANTQDTDFANTSQIHVAGWYVAAS